MLRLWRDRLRIGLSPERLTLVRVSRGLRPRVLAKISLPVPAGETWKPAVDLLQKTLQVPDRKWQNTEATVIVANRLVRYQLVPWSDEISSPEERDLYVRQSFAQVYGDVATEWAYTVSEVARGASWFVCAMERDLLAQLDLVLAQSGCKTLSVMPHLMPVFNTVRRSIKPAHFWFVQVEKEKLLLAMVQKGHWLTLSSRQIVGNGWQQELPFLLEREWRVNGMHQAPREVVISAPEASQAVLEGEGKWVFHWLRTSLPYGMSGQADAPYAMAMGA